MLRKSLFLALAAGVCLVVAGCLLRPGKTPTKLTYKLPTTLTIDRGQTLPGTNIVYEEMSDRGAHLRIGGQLAIKRNGDSLNWEGSPSAGVQVSLRLRVAWHSEDQVRLVGIAEVVVQDTSPRKATISTESPISYTGAAAYNLAKGAAIPGSTLSYQGRTDEGAQLGGTDEYPYRKGGDSIYWEGMLRDNVAIRLELRVVQYDDRALRLAGIVSLWIG